MRGGRRERGGLARARRERARALFGGQGQQRAVRRAERASQGGGERRAGGAAAQAHHRGVRQGWRRDHSSKRA